MHLLQPRFVGHQAHGSCNLDLPRHMLVVKDRQLGHPTAAAPSRNMSLALHRYSINTAGFAPGPQSYQRWACTFEYSSSRSQGIGGHSIAIRLPDSLTPSPIHSLSGEKAAGGRDEALEERDVFIVCRLPSLCCRRHHGARGLPPAACAGICLCVCIEVLHARERGGVQDPQWRGEGSGSS